MSYQFQSWSYTTLFFALNLFLISCSNDPDVTEPETIGESSTDSSSSAALSSSSTGASSYTFTDWSTCVNDGVCGTFIDKRETPAKNYRWVTIGTQTWMAQNLSWLPSVNTLGDTSTIVSKYYVLGYEGTSVSTAKATDNYATYGVLYNFPAALTACPIGWHLPTYGEWITLDTTVGTPKAGTILRAKTGWKSGGITGTDRKGFSALPGGMASCCAFYGGNGVNGLWWTATPTVWSVGDSSFAFHRYIESNSPGLHQELMGKGAGLSVRCLKD